MLALTIREKNGEERQLIFDKEEVTIGRATGSDIVLPRSNISKRHARLVDKHDKVVIVDLRSTNGTYVNGRRITAPELLTYEDKVYIGDFVIRLSRPAEQHPSQRMTAPYSASPTPLADGPRSPRAATVAVDPPSADAMSPELYEEEVAPPGPPPAHDIDDDASTRAIDASLAAQIDEDDEPPPPKKAAPAPAPLTKKTPPAPEPAPPKTEPAPLPKKEAPAAAAPPAPAPAPKKEPPPPAPAPKKEPPPPAPAPKKEPAAAARPATAPPSEDNATIMSLGTRKQPAPEPRLPARAPVAEVEPEPMLDEATSSETDAWGEWNAMLTVLVSRVEHDHPDGVEPGEAQDVIEGAIAAAIEAGEIAADTDRDALLADALSEVAGLGPLAELEGDPSVRVVVANGPKAVFVDRGAGILEPNGRLFATSSSYRKALAMLVSGTGHRMAEPPDVAPGADEIKLGDGSVLRILEPGAGADPLVVWRRSATDAPSMADLMADRFIDQAQEKDLAAAMAAGKSLLVCGPHANVLAAGLASAWPGEKRIVAVGDGTRVALTHANVARVAPGALIAATDLLALEPDGLVFEQLDGRSAYFWLEVSLTSGRPVLAVSSEPNAERALKRLALALELHGLPGRGATLVGEAVDLAVTTKTEADGQTRIDRIDEVEAQKDGYALKARPRR
ncbi:MAG: FHA domain-containing protein [Myxococcota bacterium]